MRLPDVGSHQESPEDKSRLARTRGKNISAAHHCQLTAIDGLALGLVVVNPIYYLICFPHGRENMIAAKRRRRMLRK